MADTSSTITTKDGTTIFYKDWGMRTTHADIINADLLSFFKA